MTRSNHEVIPNVINPKESMLMKAMQEPLKFRLTLFVGGPIGGFTKVGFAVRSSFDFVIEGTVGFDVGSDVGEKLGAVVGSDIGRRGGGVDGLRVGNEVGSDLFVGSDVGKSVGMIDVPTVGNELGSDVGS